MALLKRILLSGLAMYGTDAKVIRGINDYAQEQGNWLLLEGWHLHQGLKFYDMRKDVDGIIANLARPTIVPRFRRLGLPLVNVSAVLPEQAGFPYVTPDHAAVGRMAARYFVDKGFRHFAFELPPDWVFDSIMAAVRAYRDTLRELGFNCICIRKGAYPRRVLRRMWGAKERPLQCGIVDAPKPLAVFATQDRLAAVVARECREARIAVPEQVAILGADDFELFCDITFPPLSSVRLPGRDIGYAAAGMLDQLLRGERLRSPRLLLPPTGITTRRSSNTLAVQDPVVARAVLTINENLQRRLRVSDVARAIGINRRSLERRFRHALRRSVLEEIRQTMLTRALELVETTRQPMSEIARACGFRDAVHMNALFKARLNRLPRKIRRGAVLPGTVPRRN